MLIYGAFAPTVRRFTLVIAGISKIVFIFLIIRFGIPYLEFDIGTAVIVDALMVVFYAVYLLLTIKDSIPNERFKPKHLQAN